MKRITNGLAFFVAAGLLWPGAASAASQNGYRVTAPPAFPVFNSPAPAAWAASNGHSVVWTSGGSAVLTNGLYPVAYTQTKTLPVYRLSESLFGSPFEHIKPEYYLGDQIAAPANVNWEATVARLRQSQAYADNAVFYEPSVPGVFVSMGGLTQIDWILNDGSTNSHFYQVSGSSEQKPYRIYWTDEPYNSPPVDLTGKFVKFYGNPEILDLGYALVTNNAGGMPTAITNVVSGLFLDPATHWLKALGGVEGMVVMAYYRTGSYEELLGTIVVEVRAPDPETVSGTIGGQLLPTGDGYDVSGLTALVSQGLDDEDGVGPYVYQHRGQHSYSPKNGNLYAIRKTASQPWKIEVYWEQQDLMGTSWPFEVLNYACDWPAETEMFVRGQEAGADGSIDYGLTVTIPSSYTPTLMEYQEPAGHALLDNSTFSSRDSGYSLLKLTGTDVNGDDNIWFVPVHSLWRDDPQFDLTPGSWPVGTEVTPLPTSIALAFDGTEASLETGITNQLSGSFTVEGWFQCEKTGGVLPLFSRSCTTNTADGLLDLQAEVLADGRVRATLGSSAAHVAACSVTTAGQIGLGDGAWHHIALVYDQGALSLELCVDGVPTAGAVAGARPAVYQGGLCFGRDPTNAASFFSGKMDDLRVWSRALGTNEIVSGSTGFLHISGTETNLVAYYPVDDGQGRSVPDESGQGHDATMVNCIRAAPGKVGLSDMDAFSQYHGYIYEPVSGDNYNTNLYVPPDSATAGGATTNETSETYIFAVNKTPDGGLPLEVWWSHEVSQEAMPDALWFPAWVQTYTFDWPDEAFEVPEIALASQLGSANRSPVKLGVALDFSKSVNSRMTIASGDWFSGSAYTVECWVKPHALGDAGQVFNFNNGDSVNGVSLTVLPGGEIQYSVSESAVGVRADLQPGAAHKLRLGWNHLALVVGGGQATIYQDGQAVYQSSGVTLPSWTAATTNNTLAYGVQSGARLSFDGQIDEFRIWRVARSAADIQGHMLATLTGEEVGLCMYFPFDRDIGYTTEALGAYDWANKNWAAISFASWVLPGAPRLNDGVLASGATPFVYYQNDRAKPGYNPNEEHAFVQAGQSGYVTYALRCDLNRADSSEPYVLVQYSSPADGRPKMQVYHVVLTNRLYAAFADVMTAGTVVPGPHPLDLLPDPWNEKTFWDDAANAASPGYRDRKLQVWGKCAGADGGAARLVMHNFYPVQDGFFFPSLAASGLAQPEAGTPVPWLCRVSDPVADVLAGEPFPWTWTVSWPSESPELDIGQTLTQAAEGLPEVWGAKSIQVIYKPDEGSVALYDPVVNQTAAAEYEDNFAEYFGFETGPSGDVQEKNGRTFFNGVPPNVSDRFYFDAAAAKSSCLRLSGRRVAHAGGLSYLQLNVLSDEEREALKRLAHAHTNAWSEAIEGLAVERVDTDDQHGVVNYALTHMGPGAGGYVTLIENDATNKVFGVNEGDPIQMHILRLSTNLYAGALLPLTDPYNLLSEQLDILYTESFAGQGSEFEFEWKRAEPNANGTTPTDYENAYSLYRREAGLTRFTIGKQGDTLADMVNNFYVMRYRAVSNTPAFAAVGGKWSDWVSPTLAEGWVQRVVNGVTPFTQRMQDLYNNPAETQVSMLAQAGPPYEGDVALNQDNLTSVGLIQLYQTVLNKAESMSLTLGINDTAANQQLMLAATRLNDLYMLLGNEAYADAMDPTIGFGSDYFNADDFSLVGVDYGALSSSLFCFDNLVPTLCDEELALLRGRSDELAPSLHLSPTYNRLYWNFAKGITAGEVAYAMNYQIYGEDATIDQPQAAALYPQGHGDAWGHYLSALYGYYRLLRNPSFSWGTPSITPLMVGDAVVDADYYDEEKFAESAAAMARAGIEVVRRTCEKAYVENGGAPLAGYFDEDPNRAFGYGEWGARAGLAALYNWAAGNSLLPPAADPASYEFLTFATNTQLQCLSPSAEVDFSSDFTLEFKIKPDAAEHTLSDPCVLFDWRAAGTSRGSEGSLDIALDFSVNGLVLRGSEPEVNCLAMPPVGQWSHVALTYSRASSLLTCYLDGVQQGAPLSVAMPAAVTNPVIVLAANDSPSPFVGALSEFRIWNVVRTATELQAARDGVSATADGLLMYQRFIADAAQGGTLPDEACDASWQLSNPVWVAQSVAGADLDFADESILRINRGSVGSLQEIGAAMKGVQRSVDLADAGMTPFGLSDSAVPFDIDPAELAAGKSHFEQIASRAEQALANAATLLDRAQGVSKLQRQQTQNASNLKQDLANEEAALNTQLIGIYGYPYEGDIGAGCTYPQDYDGPDIYHYMWMDLASYGFEDFELEPKKSTVYTFKKMATPENSDETLTLTFELASNGMVLKPDDIDGTRRAQGRLQAAYGAFIQAYLAYRKALLVYDEKDAYLENELGWLDTQLIVNAGVKAMSEYVHFKEYREQRKAQRKLRTLYITQDTSDAEEQIDEDIEMSTPRVLIAGMAVGTDVGAPISAATTAISTPVSLATKALINNTKLEISIAEAESKKLATLLESVKDLAELTFSEHEMVASVERLVMEVNAAALDLDGANAALINSQESFKAVLAEGEQLLSKRETLRKQATNRIAAGRYQDMAFRTFRSDALAEYGNAFDLAKKYTYLAAKAYDYETALGLGNGFSGDSIFCEIAGARNLGFVKDGVAQPGGLHGDGGLADILARLKANWLVLRGRLGINNSQSERCWLSLRTELFRMRASGSDAQKAWQDKLASCRVDNLLDNAEFRRYCLSFQSASGLQSQEPGLLIPFSTSIDFARNVFGLPLAGGDNAFDSSYYATKISKLGICFVGYNAATGGVVALGNEPRVYLIPVGYDVMRTPGNTGGDLLMYNVVDQVVPVPYPLGAAALDEQDWSSVYNAYTGGGDPLASIRRYPSVRAYHDHGSFSESDMLSNTRLVGRSVWNTRWLLIIPAGTLAADRDFALEALIHGADLNQDGKLDQPGIRDILIGFETYSNSGN